MILLNTVKLTWYEILEDGTEKEHVDLFKGFTFEAIQKEMETFMAEKNIDIVKNKCKAEVIS